jgi:hypothetical protein
LADKDVSVDNGERIMLKSTYLKLVMELTALVVKSFRSAQPILDVKDESDYIDLVQRLIYSICNGGCRSKAKKKI